MKKYIKYFAVAAASVLALASCKQEQLNQESVIKDSRAEQTEFDKWLANNLLNPYNIQIKYRYEYLAQRHCLRLIIMNLPNLKVR